MASLSPGDRPREKLERVGVDALGDNELVALVLGHGPRGASALSTANRLLEASGGVTGLTRVHRRHLLKVRGIGPAQAGRLLAAVELGRRTLQEPEDNRRRFSTSAEAAAYLLPRFGAAPVERFGVMLLDVRLRVLGVELVSVGGIDASLASPKDVFRLAIGAAAAAVVLFHNHPSGDPTPSRDDVHLTQHLAASGTILGIDVMDHIILADRKFVSMRDERFQPWRA